MKQKLLLKTMLLLCALIAGSSSVWAEDQTITLTYSSFGLETSYKEKTATVSGFGFTVDQGYKGSGNVIQMNSSKGNGILYNTTPIPGLKSITVNVSSGNKTYTITTGTSMKPTANSQTGTTGGTYNATSGDSYFQLKVSGASYFSSIVITYTPTHTLTYSATNGSISGVFYNTSTAVASGASVVEDGKVTLAATPTGGYRFSSWEVSGTGSALSSTSTNPTTFTMGTANATVTAIFEEIPSHTLSTAVSPASAGTVELGATSIKEGATTTATAAAAAGYKFTSWSISGTGASLSSTTTNPTTVTMGTADAILTANFEAVTTHAISYSVNGNVVKTVNVEENAAVDLSAPASGIPAGYVFKGWVVEANKIDTPTDTDPKANYVTSATSTANITYYAVLAFENPGTATWTLDYEEDNASGKSVKDDITLGYGSAVSYTAADGGAWVIKAYKQNGMQINKNKDASIKVPSCSGKITSIALTLYSGATNIVGFSADDYTGGAIEDVNYLAVASSAGTSQTLDLSSKNATTGYIVPNGGNAQITKIVVTYSKSTFSGYCTTIPPATITLASACTDGEKYYGTYSNSSAFVVPADLTVSCVGVSGDELVVTNYSTGDVVKANTGVLVSSTTSGNHDVTLSAETGTEKDGNLLKASVFGITAANMNEADTKFYRLTMHNGTQIGFWWGAAEGAAFALGANKAYLAVPTGAGAPSLLWFDNGSTGIDEVRGQTEEVRGEYYNLSGQRVANPTKGLYIVNGRKVVIK